jgi:transcription elongation factor S-II
MSTDTALIEQCITIKKQLSRELERTIILELLGGLDNFRMTKDILRGSLIGKTVNEIFKHQTDPVVKDKAKSLVLKWKALAAGKDPITPKSTPTTPSQSWTPSQSLSRELSSGSGIGSMTPPSGLGIPPRRELMKQDIGLSSFRSDGTPVGQNKAKQRRIEIRKKLLSILKMEVEDLNNETDKQDLLDVEETVVAIEEELWSQLVKRDDDKAYMTQLRSIMYNLKDPKNPNFNYKILAGFFKPENLPTMTAEDMASEAKQKERAKHRQDSMEEIQTDWALKHGDIKISGMFTCGKCKGTQTTYFQMQTRSSDEPMTTFVTCLNCNNRWKFC